jgi:holo-[acyl-carrier protein] synthase
MGIGIDIIEIKRIKSPEALAKRILSEEEYDLFLKRANPLEFLAGRWAAKEAFLKANGVGLIGPNSIPLKEISILNEKSGKPILIYQNKTYDVSISHEKEYAVAIVII